MKISSKYIYWAHATAAEDNHAAHYLVVFSGFGSKTGRVHVPKELYPELLSVAKIWAEGGSDILPFYIGEARRIIDALDQE